MLGLVTKLFAAKGGVGKLASLAEKFVETEVDKAKAGAITTEARAALLKSIDPNGEMRRLISRRVTDIYTTFTLVLLILVLLQSFGGALGLSTEALKAIDVAINNLKEEFGSITTVFGAIIAASFGVNSLNIFREDTPKKQRLKRR